MVQTLSPRSPHLSKTTPSAEAASLRVNEIFLSLQGETSRVGLPTVFVRLTGCPLRCGYCDTEYAFHEGERMSLAAILSEVARHGVRHVTVTGGEPLAQKECVALLRLLCDAGYSVSLETSGALDISGVDERVSRILDLKTPGSGEVEKNLWNNIQYLTSHDEVKFVLCDEGDYRWAVEVMGKRQLDHTCPVLFSPAYGRLDPAVLAEWIVRDRLPVRMQVQLHKLLWGEGPGR
ncbi:MAG TPA: 7-carboxy-7-deazaguanine synthase QueE [Nitrosospira sp.]|nr:7-carboxy-7-deazaguanine synthase QueE [Nitrosospira sp.]